MKTQKDRSCSCHFILLAVLRDSRDHPADESACKWVVASKKKLLEEWKADISPCLDLLQLFDFDLRETNRGHSKQLFITRSNKDVKQNLGEV